MSPYRFVTRTGLLAGLLAAATGVACGQEKPAAPNTLTAAEQAAGWRLLFDGATTKGWRGYMQDSMPAGWQVVDGVLARVAPAADIVYHEKFKNFELLVDWKIAPKGNSGIFYRGIEGPEAIYYSAPEMQVLDDSGHVDGRTQLTSAGAVYGLYPAPRGIVKPVGEWNHARILVNGNHVEHWLNGTRIAAYELGSADWSERVAKSKFKQWPEYGKAAEGYIGLQEHGNWIGFRNIKIRVLP
jgi:alpha-3'-ketoglucosidase